MSQALDNAVSIVRTVVEPLVNHPEELSVDGSEDGARLLVEIRTAPDDAAKVIGRQGRIIRAIRTLTRAASSGKADIVDVEYVD